VEDKDGKVLVEFSAKAERAISLKTSEELVKMLRGAVNQGTGQAIRSQYGIRLDVAGKTGTTQDNTDGWFLLMHPRLVVGTWVGFNDSRVTMRSSYWGQGARNALPVVGEFFQRAANGRMFDTRVQFPRARDAIIGSSIWGPVLDWWEDLFGEEPKETKPPAGTKPKQEKGKADPGMLDEMQRQINEWMRTFERTRRDIEKTIDDIQKAFG
jgi:penicillin-binding protein 1A